MDTRNPGIFIPLLSSQGHINISKGEEVIPYGSTKLFNALQKGKRIKDYFSSAVRFCGIKNTPVEYGLILHPETPQQTEYLKALKIINQAFNLQLNELTVPMENVSNPEGSIKNISVFAEKTSDSCGFLEFNEQGFALINALQSAQIENSKLILNVSATGFEIHGTSPLEYDSKIWEQCLNKALRDTGYTPKFSQTWSMSAKQ